MKIAPAILLLSSLLMSCQDRPGAARNQTAEQASPNSAPPAAPRSQPPADSSAALTPAREQQPALALTANALQLVNKETGSTREVAFGMPEAELVALMTKVLQAPPASTGVNTECGAGPLKMVSWPNGFTLVLQEKKRSAGNWQLAGWLAGAPTGTAPGPATMAGIGVGSTQAELESVYAIKVVKTSLGQEFSTTSGLYGILAGAGPASAITYMWSGASCNFR